jgi:hypothetical protein
VLALISGFRRDVDEICSFPGYYAASKCNPLLTFRDNGSIPSSMVNKSKTSLFSIFLSLFNSVNKKIIPRLKKYSGGIYPPMPPQVTPMIYSTYGRMKYVHIIFRNLIPTSKKTLRLLYKNQKLMLLFIVIIIWNIFLHKFQSFSELRSKLHVLFFSFRPLKFLSWSLHANHLYSESDSGLTDETNEMCPLLRH